MSASSPSWPPVASRVRAGRVYGMSDQHGSASTGTATNSTTAETGRVSAQSSCPGGAPHWRGEAGAAYPELPAHLGDHQRRRHPAPAGAPHPIAPTVPCSRRCAPTPGGGQCNPSAAPAGPAPRRHAGTPNVGLAVIHSDRDTYRRRTTSVVPGPDSHAILAELNEGRPGPGVSGVHAITPDTVRGARAPVRRAAGAPAPPGPRSERRGYVGEAGKVFKPRGVWHAF